MPRVSLFFLLMSLVPGYVLCLALCQNFSHTLEESVSITGSLLRVHAASKIVNVSPRLFGLTRQISLYPYILGEPRALSCLLGSLPMTAT
jgi:hypothetical protein